MFEGGDHFGPVPCGADSEVELGGISEVERSAEDKTRTRVARWDRVVEIASKLWVEGLYVAEIDPCRTQRFVDLQWAAHQAGRLLGGRARIETRRARPEDRTVTMTVRYVDAAGNSLQRAEEGLEKLLRHVLQEQRQGRDFSGDGSASTRGAHVDEVGALSLRPGTGAAAGCCSPRRPS